MAMWVFHVASMFCWFMCELSFYHFQTGRHFARNDFTSGLLLSFYTAAEAAIACKRSWVFINATFSFKAGPCSSDHIFEIITYELMKFCRLSTC